MDLSDYKFPSLYGAPYKHQVTTVEFLLKNPRSYVLSGLGSGKTLSCMWAADVLRINKKIMKVLILAPLSCTYSVWADSIFKHHPHRKYAMLTGSKDKRLKALKEDVMFYIANHDSVRVIEEELIKAEFDLVIIDEVTAYATHTSQRSKAAHRICRHAKGVWALTGTPTANSPLSAFGIARVATPNNPHLPRSFYVYRDKVCQTFDGFSWDPKEGCEKEVAKILHPAIKFDTADCIDMPDTIYIDRDVQLCDDTMKLYTKMKKEMLLEFDHGLVTAVNAAAKMTKLLQITAGGVIDTDGQVIDVDCKAKIDEIISLWDENGRIPAIISATYTASIQYINQALLDKKYKVEYIDSSKTGFARAKIVEAFQKNELDFLILQPKAASHGLNLQNSNILIHFSPIMSNETHLQVNGRIIRSGQTRKQIVVNLAASPTERRFYKALKDKTNLQDIIMQEFSSKEVDRM